MSFLSSHSFILRLPCLTPGTPTMPFLFSYPSQTEKLVKWVPASEHSLTQLTFLRKGREESSRSTKVETSSESEPQQCEKQPERPPSESPALTLLSILQKIPTTEQVLKGTRVGCVARTSRRADNSAAISLELIPARVINTIRESRQEPATLGPD
jgi:hypothetical protein